MNLRADGIPMPTDPSPPFGPSVAFTAATIALCCVVAHACASVAAKDSSFRTLAVGSQD
jgi:hypothetical protein